MRPPSRARGALFIHANKYLAAKRRRTSVKRLEMSAEIVANGR